jgi:hypothetical protein
MTLVQNLDDKVHIIPGPELTISPKMILVQNLGDKVHIIPSPELTISPKNDICAESRR